MPLLGFKAFEAAQAALIGIEPVHMIKKGQMGCEAGDEGLTAAEQFYALAASLLSLTECIYLKWSIHENMRRSPWGRFAFFVKNPG